MFRNHVIKQLSTYCDDELSAEESRRVAEHLATCDRCRKEYEEIKFGVALAKHLPVASAPDSIWNEIEQRLEDQRSGIESRRGGISNPQSRFLHLLAIRSLRTALAAVSLMIVALGIAWYYLGRPQSSWAVARLSGAPQVGSDRIGHTGQLTVGEWLETDSTSRARISVGKIGEVEVEPNTRIRLVRANAADHRLALSRGTMHARIWAPPRLFFVETPSATAVDLGCAYTLEVDDVGRSFLLVTTGWVELQREGRESFVPAGALCETRPGIGPGTPFFWDASDALKQALAKLDFEHGGSEELQRVLAEARPWDTLTLWHLLPRVDAAQRGQIYDRLASLIPPPTGVTRDGVMRLDEAMLKLWRSELESHWMREDVPIWRKAWRQLWRHLTD